MEGRKGVEATEERHRADVGGDGGRKGAKGGVEWASFFGGRAERRRAERRTGETGV